MSAIRRSKSKKLIKAEIMDKLSFLDLSKDILIDIYVFINKFSKA